MDKQTSDAIAQSIRKAWRDSSVSINQVAEMLGTTPAAISNILVRPISKRTAEVFAQKFGFSQSYLLTGEGSIYPERAASNESDTINALRETIRTQQETIRLLSSLLKEKGALSAPKENCLLDTK